MPDAPVPDDGLFRDPGGNTVTMTLHDPEYGPQEAVAYLPYPGAVCEGCGQEPLVIRWVPQDLSLLSSNPTFCHICILGLKPSPTLQFTKEQ